MNIIDIGPLQLAYCFFFILIAGAGSAALKLGLERDLLIGAIRTFGQLGILGYVLKFIFDLDNVWLVLLLFSFMVFWAAHAIRSRVNDVITSMFFQGMNEEDQENLHPYSFCPVSSARIRLQGPDWGSGPL